MAIINWIEETIDKISYIAFKIARWLVLILSFTLFYEVFMRYIFNKPTIWSYDVSYMIGGIFFTLGMAYTHQKGINVRVDVFYNMFKRKSQAIINIIGTIIFFFPTFSMLIWRMIPYVQTSWIRKEKALGSFWMPPIYPFKTMLLIAIVLLYLQVISTFIKECKVLYYEITSAGKGVEDNV